jgi:hypothetical protein
LNDGTHQRGMIDEQGFEIEFAQHLCDTFGALGIAVVHDSALHR